MLDRTSRYRAVGEASIECTYPDGTTRPVRYLLRRFVADPAGGPAGERQVAAGDRVDRLAAELLGDPRLFWLLADANRVLRPSELAAEPGRWISVDLPSPGSP